MTQAQINQRKALGSQRVKPVRVKARQVYQLTIFDTPLKLYNARRNNQIVMIREGGKIFYDLSLIDKIFLKTSAHATHSSYPHPSA